MKWIGQHIYDLVSRFRDDFYLEGLETSTETDMLVINSEGKVSKRAASGLTTGLVTVTDSTANTDFPVVFHDESNALLDDTGAFTYNPSTGTLTTPNLTVSGTTTTINTTNLNVEDKNITLNYNASSDTSGTADGAGITIQDAVDASNDASLTWLASADAFKFSHDILLESSTSAKPSLSLTNSNTDAEAPEIIFQKTATGADNDDLGKILFKGDDASDNVETYAQILGEIAEADHGSEEGKLTLSVASHDGELQPGLIIASGTSEDAVDVTLGTVGGVGVNINGTLGRIRAIDQVGGATDINYEFGNVDNTGSISLMPYYESGKTSAQMPNMNITLANHLPTGTDQAGKNLFLSPGRSTGNAAPGTVQFAAYKQTGASGTSTNDSDGCFHYLAFDDIEFFKFATPQCEARVTIHSNNTTASTGGEIQFKKNAADTEDGEVLGSLTFYGEDEGNNNTQFAEIVGSIAESDDGSEGGRIQFKIASHDGEIVTGLSIHDGDAEDEVDVSIAKGAASTTTIAGTLTMGSTAFVNNSGVIQVATQGTIDHDSLANFVAAEHYRWDTDLSGTTAIHRNNITDLSNVGVAGSANQLLTDDGDGTVTSESNLTFDSSTGALEMKHSGISLLTLKRTSTGSDNDTVGAIRFTGNDDADNALRYASINAKIIDASDGAEEGQLNLVVASHDGEEVTGLSLTSGNVEDEVDVTIANGAASLTTIAGDLDIDGDTITTAGNIEVATGGSGNITLDAAGDIALESAGGNLTSDAGDFTIYNTATTRPVFKLQNRTDDAACAVLTFDKNRFLGAEEATPTNGDDVGKITFTSTDNLMQVQTYAQILAEISEVTHTDEAGKLTLSVAASDGTTSSMNSGLILEGEHATSGEVDVTIGNKDTSTTTIAGTLTMGSTATLDNSGNLLTNAATATALTSGDKTIQGNLRIGGSGDTSNNWITIDAQNGTDTTGGGICFYETGTDTIGAPQYGAKIVYNEDDDELAIGTMHNNSFLRQIHMDRGSNQVLVKFLTAKSDSTDGPYLQLQNSDTSIVDTQNIGRILCRNEDRGAITSRINWVATEDHDSDSGGTKIDFIITPNGNGQSETTAMTIGQDSSLTVNGNIELGHASDTTIARSAAGTATIEGNQIMTAGVATGNIIHYAVPKYIAIYMFYMNTVNHWYTPPGYNSAITTSAGLDGTTLSASYQARMANYTAPRACKIKKVSMVFYQLSLQSGDLDLEWGLVKWTPNDDTSSTTTMTEMTITNHDGAFTETDVHRLIFDVTDNAASTLAAGDCVAFCGRVTSGSGTVRNLINGQMTFEIELT